MKRIVRRNTFETNSSSTHAICIATESKLYFPDSLHFKLGEFGWEFSVLDDPESKASYLFTAIVHLNEDESRMKLPIDEWYEICWIKDVLARYGVEATFQDPPWEKFNYSDGYFLGYGYIDHGYELSDFLNDVLVYEDLLIKFLFTDASYILTGNDNSYHNVHITAEYPHEEYYKGN